MIPQAETIMKAAVCLALFALTGCALTNPTDPYAPVPDGYPRAAMTSGPTPDYRAERSSRPLGLDECIRIALENNPQIGARSWDVEAAQAQRDVTAAQRWPALSAQGGYTRYDDNQRLVPARVPNEPGAWSRGIASAGLVLSMPLFTGGQIINEVRAAELLSLAADRRLARTRSELVFNVSSTFYSILGQRRVIESLEFSRKALEQQRKRVQDLMAAQKAAKVDLLRTDVRLADLDQRILSEKNTLAIEQQLLANLMGVREDGAALTVQGDLALTPAPVEQQATVEKALAQRGDYLAARAEVEGQAKRVDAARAERWPTLSLVGSFGGLWAAGDTTRQPGASNSEDVGSAGLSLSVPLFEGGRIDADVRRERANLAAAQEGLRGLELQIRLEVQTALLNVNSSLERVRATEKAIEQAQESLRIEQEKYELGKGSITDVLDAQSALLDSQTNYYRALADYDTALAQLRLAVGEQ
jgi:outer membrane protein TolC